MLRFAIITGALVFGIVAGLASTPAAAQFLPGPGGGSAGMGGIFFPGAYGMRPPRADNAWVRENTAPSPPPRGYDSWAQYHGRQMGIGACMQERNGYYQNSRSYCEGRGY